MKTKEDIVISFVFETYDEGKEIQKALFEIKREKGYVTYNDLALLIYGKEMLPHSSKLGWTDLSNIDLKPGNEYLEYWILTMPEVMNLKTIIKNMKKENK